MTTYVAFLRGIMPMNPNMRNEKLRGVFESLGFENVHTVIASGNVIFQSSSEKSDILETKLEKALFDELGFHSTTIIRTKKDLEQLVEKNPFKDLLHSRQNYLIVTFLKHTQKEKDTPENRPREIATVINLTTGKTPDFMREAEKRFGKDITTRTWNTVVRILTKMAS